MCIRDRYTPVIWPYTTDGTKKSTVIIGMMPSINGGFPNSVPSSALITELAGRQKATRTRIITSKEMCIRDSVFHRLLVPRHPPCALISLTNWFAPWVRCSSCLLYTSFPPPSRYSFRHSLFLKIHSSLSVLLRLFKNAPLPMYKMCIRDRSTVA